MPKNEQPMTGSAAKPAALDPMNSPADWRAMERWAYRTGHRVRFKDGRAINPQLETWPAERIDRELPAVDSSILPASPPETNPPRP